MPKYAHPDVLDGGLSALKSSAAKVLLISTYAAGDSYATVTGNKLAEANVATSDVTLAADGTGRKATLAAGKTGTASASAVAGSNLHVAITDGSARVLFVTDETTDQAIASGNTVNFPAVVYQSGQPT